MSITIAVITYFNHLITRMYNFEDDKYQSQSIVNLYDEDITEELRMSDYDFIPSLDINLLDQRSKNVEEFSTEVKGVGLLIDMEKLKDYIEIAIVVRHRQQGESYYHYVNFSNCNTTELSDLITDKQILQEFQYRLCPDIAEFKKHALVRGSYSMGDRVSFSLEIHRCNAGYSSNCRNDSEISSVLEKVYFTMYNI